MSVFFTGMINILHGLGLRFLALGHHTPFMVFIFELHFYFNVYAWHIHGYMCYLIVGSWLFSSVSLFKTKHFGYICFNIHHLTAHWYGAQLQKRQPGHPSSEGLWV